MKMKPLILAALLGVAFAAEEKKPSPVATEPSTNMTTLSTRMTTYNRVSIADWLTAKGKEDSTAYSASLAQQGHFTREHTTIISKHEPTVTKQADGSWVVSFGEKAGGAENGPKSTQLVASQAKIGGAETLESSKKLAPPPTKEFVAGFEAGVRYGAIALMGAQEKNVASGKHPNDLEIPALTDEAKKLYYLIAAGGWKDLMEERK